MAFMKAPPAFIRTGIAALIATCLLPSLSLGWGYTWMGINLEQTYEALMWRAGLLRGVGAFNLTNAGYSSDIYYGSTPEPVPDAIMAAGPNFRAMLPVDKKLVFDVSANPQYLFYLSAKNERAWNATVGGNLHVVLDKLYFLAGGQYGNTRERMAAELDINVRREQTGLTGLALWQASRAVSFALQGRKTSFDYSDVEGMQIRERLNRNEQVFNLRAYFQRVARIRISLDAEYGTYTFTADPASRRDSQSYGLYGGIEYIPSTDTTAEERGISGVIHLGYGRLDLNDPLQIDYGGLVGSAALTTNIFHHLSAHGFFERGAEFSLFAGISYYLLTSYGAGLTHSLSRRVSLTYDLSLSRSEYLVGGDEGQPLRGLDHKYTVHSFRAGLRLKRNLTVDLIANLSTRSGSDLIADGGRNFFGLSLTYGYSPGTTAFITDPIAR